MIIIESHRIQPAVDIPVAHIPGVFRLRLSCVLSAFLRLRDDSGSFLLLIQGSLYHHIMLHRAHEPVLKGLSDRIKSPAFHIL